MIGGRYDSVAGLLTMVEVYLEETGMASSNFGILATGDPSLVPGIRKGRVCSLDTADRVLEFMGLEPVAPAFRREVETFLSVTRTKAYLFGYMVMSNPTFMQDLRRGVDINLETVGQVLYWMDANSTDGERARVCVLVAAGKDGDGPGRETAAGEEWMEMTEVAPLVGLSSRTLHRFLETGEGPVFHRFGDRVLYLRADVRAWIDGRRVEPGGDNPGDWEAEFNSR